MKSARSFHYKTPQGKLETKEIVRDLWITFKPTGKFDKHISSVVAKGNGMVGWISRTFRTRLKELIPTLLKTLVTPQVEYGSIIWIPTSQNSIYLIESIQRRFTKMAGCFHFYDNNLQMLITTISYHKQVKMLIIYSLQKRRGRMPSSTSTAYASPRAGICKNSTTKVTPKRNISRASQSWIKSSSNESLFVTSPPLYNSIFVRELENEDKEEKQKVENLEKDLDEYLRTIPDTSGTSQNSFLQQNSLCCICS